MQFFTILLTLFAMLSASSASSIVARQGPPSCANPCLTTTNTFGCSNTDNACLCRNSQFVAAQEACFNTACTNPGELAAAVSFAHQLCLFVGVTLSSTTPPSTATATGSAASSSTSSSAPAASSSSNSAVILTSTSSSLALLAGVAAAIFTL